MDWESSGSDEVVGTAQVELGQIWKEMCKAKNSGWPRVIGPKLYHLIYGSLKEDAGSIIVSFYANPPNTPLPYHFMAGDEEVQEEVQHLLQTRSSQAILAVK